MTRHLYYKGGPGHDGIGGKLSATRGLIQSPSQNRHGPRRRAIHVFPAQRRLLQISIDAPRAKLASDLEWAIDAARKAANQHSRDVPT